MISAITVLGGIIIFIVILVFIQLLKYEKNYVQYGSLLKFKEILSK
nr:MAG: hypothetical protein [Bacteriophage sp.]